MMDVQPEGIDLSAVTESNISATMAASASAAAPALLGATPMGLDGDSAQFAAALNAAGGAYLASTAEHAGQRVAYSATQALSSTTYRAVDAIDKATLAT
ncbi:hypothetical protein BH11ACT7_BH11ACT7_38860 [soil metagenome]